VLELLYFRVAHCPSVIRSVYHIVPTAPILTIGLNLHQPLMFPDLQCTPVTLTNYALVSGNPVRAHTDEFTMAAAGRASGPTRAVPGITAQHRVSESLQNYAVIALLF